MERKARNTNRIQRLNVLILADTLEVYGGAERHVLDLINNFDKDKYNLFVSSLIPGGDLLKEISSCGAHVKLFPVKRIYSIFGILRGFAFVRFLKKNKIDILMTLHFGSDIWGAIFGKLAGVSYIISNRRDTGFWKKKRHIIAYKLISRFVDVIITNSKAGKDKILQDEDVIPEKVEVVHGAVEVHKFKPSSSPEKIRQSLGIGIDKIIIGSVGNFNPIKGHKYLIEAAVNIIKKIHRVHFLLVGDGLLKESLQSIVHARQIQDKVTFLGSRNDIPDILSIMDICILPSLSEGLSIALMEYMAAGKTIIATNVGGNPELIENGISGMLIEAGSSNEIKKAVMELINNKEKAAYLATNAHKRAENELDMPTLIGKYENILSRRRRKRILHLISSNGLFGAEKVLLDIAGYNQQNGADVVVAAIRNAHNPHIEVIGRAKKRGLETVVFDSGGRIDIKTIIHIKKYIKEKVIDILHTHNYKSDILVFFASRFTKTKWVATNHVWHGTDRKLKLYELIDAFLLKFADKVIAVSDEIKDNLIKKGIDRNKIKRIYNGIKITDFDFQTGDSNLRNAFGINDNEIIVTTVGRLSPEKGHAILLKAAEKIVKEKNNIKFLIVGDGPLVEELHSYVMNNGLKGKVIFTGIRDDIPQILSISDIYVNSSYIEGLPLTILEAMSVHLPVIATKVGAAPEIIVHDKTGILLDCGDAQTLAKEIGSLISNSNRRQSLAKKAYQDVCDKFSLERMGRDYENVYQEVLT